MLHTLTHTRARTLEFLFRRFVDFGFDFGAACEREGKRRGGGGCLKNNNNKNFLQLRSLCCCYCCCLVSLLHTVF